MNAVFRVYRYAPTYPGLVGRDLTPGQPVELYATPATTFALTVHSAGNGTGVVTNTPGGSVFLAGTVVTLTATPDLRLVLYRLERRCCRGNQSDHFGHDQRQDSHGHFRTKHPLPAAYPQIARSARQENDTLVRPDGFIGPNLEYSRTICFHGPS